MKSPTFHCSLCHQPIPLDDESLYSPGVCHTCYLSTPTVQHHLPICRLCHCCESHCSCRFRPPTLTMGVCHDSRHNDRATALGIRI